MPDLDRLERCLLSSWRPAYRLLEGGHPPKDQGICASLEEAKRKLIDLLARYSGEWESFPATPPRWEFGSCEPHFDWRSRLAS